MSTILFGCQIEDNSTPSYTYNLNLKITDINGTDLVTEIPYKPNPSTDPTYDIDTDECELKSLTKGVGLGLIYTQIDEEIQSLYISLGSRESKYQSVTFLLTSRYIFKDMVPRKITTTWEHNYYDGVCTSLKFEDEEFTVTKNETNFFNYATIIVD
ncbi:MAG: hypothetical protein RR388_05535 [Rikenellaceae bacterium]